MSLPSLLTFPSLIIGVIILAALVAIWVAGNGLD
jgi:hypothetical protein